MFRGGNPLIPVGYFCVLAAISHLISGTAGAGSLILEFGTLSRLTGDERFEKVAYKAFFALWNRKSSLGLVANTINIWTGVCADSFPLHRYLLLVQLWTPPEFTGIGAGIDSFYEYALKWYILSGVLSATLFKLISSLLSRYRGS